MTADLILSGGLVVSETAVDCADVAIKDGEILAVGAPSAMPPAAETVDVSGLHLLPGAIDVHVHFRDPGYTHKEDWESGAAAAAMGGVTTVFEMPNTVPPTSTPEALYDKATIAGSKSCVDFGLYALLGEETLDRVQALADAGANAFKLYMGNTFGNLPSPSTGAMLECFEKAALTGLRVSLHAETASIMARREAALSAAGRTAPLDHILARPEVVAIEAVARAAILAEWTGARIHILHISSSGELRPLAEAKARGVDVTGETCPCYLFLDSSDYERLQGAIRVNPPVREKKDSEGILAALKAGVVDMIATDHAPHTPEEKLRPDIWDVDCGFPGVETQMPLMLTRVAAGDYSIMDSVRMSAGAPARSFGLWPTKGRIAPGAHADIACVDLARRETIRAENLHSRSRITPFEGTETLGAPVHTLVRGAFVQRDRKLVPGMQGHGRQVTDIQRMPAPAPRNVELSLAHLTGGAR